MAEPISLRFITIAPLQVPLILRLLEQLASKVPHLLSQFKISHLMMVKWWKLICQQESIPSIVLLFLQEVLKVGVLDSKMQLGIHFSMFARMLFRISFPAFTSLILRIVKIHLMKEVMLAGES